MELPESYPGWRELHRLNRGRVRSTKTYRSGTGRITNRQFSAAFRNLSKDQAADITERYDAFCSHYNMVPTRNNRGVAHENGAVESPHGHLKRRIVQQLQMNFPEISDQRYSFQSIDSFQAYVNAIVGRHNRRNENLLREELALMSPLPIATGVDYTEKQARVSSSSTISVCRVTYSVPCQMINERLCVRLYDDRLECYLGSTRAVTLKRLHPKGNHRSRQIDYRHLIGSLARKPMAFFHAQLRDDILPNNQWKQLWLQCCQRLAPRQSCCLIVGALAIAATHDNETLVANTLQTLLNETTEPSLLVLQQRLGLASTTLPEITIQTTPQHDLNDYDDLLKNKGGDQS